MRNLYKVLLVIAVVGAGVVFYAKKKNIDLKTLFSSECDCHAGGCDLKSANTPAAHPEPVHASTPPAPHFNAPAPVHQVPAQPVHAAPVVPAKPAAPVKQVVPVAPVKPAVAPVKA